MALPPHFEDGVRERPADIDGERDPAGVSWLHGPRLYSHRLLSRAGNEAIGGPNAILARGGALFLAGLSISNGPFDNEGRAGAHVSCRNAYGWRLFIKK